MTTGIQKCRLRWFGHVERMDTNNWVKRSRKVTVMMGVVEEVGNKRLGWVRLFIVILLLSIYSLV